jgi:hypothetical protein
VESRSPQDPDDLDLDDDEREEKRIREQPLIKCVSQSHLLEAARKLVRRREKLCDYWHADLSSGSGSSGNSGNSTAVGLGGGNLYGDVPGGAAAGVAAGTGVTAGVQQEPRSPGGVNLEFDDEDLKFNDLGSSTNLTSKKNDGEVEKKADEEAAAAPDILDESDYLDLGKGISSKKKLTGAAKIAAIYGSGPKVTTSAATSSGNTKRYKSKASNKRYGPKL